MLNQCITILAQAVVTGPDGKKLKPGKTYEYEDSIRLRLLVKSGTVSLIDPASFDETYLEAAGYELQEGYSYPEKVVEKEPEKKEVPKKNSEQASGEMNSKEPTPEEAPEEVPDHEPMAKQLTPSVGMGVKKSSDLN